MIQQVSLKGKHAWGSIMHSEAFAQRATYAPRGSVTHAGEAPDNGSSLSIEGLGRKLLPKRLYGILDSRLIIPYWSEMWKPVQTLKVSEDL
jgi:hypothetical protein